MSIDGTVQTHRSPVQSPPRSVVQTISAPVPMDVTPDSNEQPFNSPSKAVMEDGQATGEVVDPVVPVGTWFRIELSGVTAEVDVRQLFELFQARGLIGARIRKNKTGKGAARTRKKVMLSFKAEQKRDVLLSMLLASSEHKPWPFDEAIAVPVERQEALSSFRYVLCPEYVEMCYSQQKSPEDLAMMLQDAPPYREIGDLRELHPFPLPGD